MTEDVVSNGPVPQKPQDNGKLLINGLKPTCRTSTKPIDNQTLTAISPTLSSTATKSTVADFFAHKNVFVTGGTGFLGTVLIEALLSATPDIGTIYVLVRAKRNISPKDRIKRLTEKSIFEKHDKKTLAKVVPVVGELSDKHFGFEEAVLEELIDRVNIIYHSAATIKFSTPLHTAITTNLIGTLRTIELAKRVRNLSAYIYCSTAFCNSNNRGIIMERVYEGHHDPYEMMRMAEDETVWHNFTSEDCKKIIGDHPNTYTFTKNLSENLIVAEMKNMPVAIVRPSIVYGTLEKPLSGWVGNANSGHLGFIAGFIKGVFRTMCGRPSTIIDIIPCDYVINASLVMGWYVGTRRIEQPEVIHCTSGEVNPLTNSEFCKYINDSVQRHPSHILVWKPHAKLRNGWRYNLFFYLFHLFPAIFCMLPEKIFQLGMRNHTLFDYMLVFHRGAKAFDYFLDRDFRYDLSNALRIKRLLTPSDQQLYNFDASHCNWAEFLDRMVIGVRRFYFKESAVTTTWHHYCWKAYNFINYMAYVISFIGLFVSLNFCFDMKIGFILAASIWSFLAWL